MLMSIDSTPSNYNDCRKLLIDCYKLAGDMSSKFVIDDEDLLKIITACLFIKIHNTTKAILLLIDNNLLSETQVLLRHQIESLFVLKACYEDESFWEEYIYSDERIRLKWSNIMTQNKIFRNHKEYDEEKIIKLRKELETIVDEKGIKELQIESLSRKAKLERFYNTTYRLLSNIVHVGVRSLSSYLIFDDNGEIKDLTIYPHQDDFAILYLTSAELSIIAIKTISDIFKIKVEMEVKELQKRFSELLKKYPK
jgi:hypothetical protein